MTGFIKPTIRITPAPHVEMLPAPMATTALHTMPASHITTLQVPSHVASAGTTVHPIISNPESSHTLHSTTGLSAGAGFETSVPSGINPWGPVGRGVPSGSGVQTPIVDHIYETPVKFKGYVGEGSAVTDPSSGQFAPPTELAPPPPIVKHAEANGGHQAESDYDFILPRSQFEHDFDRGEVRPPLPSSPPPNSPPEAYRHADAGATNHEVPLPLPPTAEVGAKESSSMFDGFTPKLLPQIALGILGGLASGMSSGLTRAGVDALSRSGDAKGSDSAAQDASQPSDGHGSVADGQGVALNPPHAVSHDIV